MIDFGVPETAEQHPCPEWERKVAAHVEELVKLGWKWEGRGLVPSVNAWVVSNVDSRDNNIETM